MDSKPIRKKAKEWLIKLRYCSNGMSELVETLKMDSLPITKLVVQFPL